MSKEVINNKQGYTLITLFITGSSLVLPTAVQAGRDLWIAILLAIVWGFFLVSIYARLLSLYPGQDLFSILQDLLGPFIGKFFIILYIWFAFHLGTLVLNNFSNYLVRVGLHDTPTVFPAIIFVFLCIWGVREGIEVLGRWANLALIFLLVLISIVVLLNSTQWKIERLKPVFYHGYQPILAGAFSTLSFPFGEVVLFLMVFMLDKKNNSSYKIFYTGLLIGGGLLFITSLNELLTLGIDIYKQSYFPSFTTVRRINVGDFIQRLEIGPSVALLAGGFIKISICLLATSKGITKLFNLDDYRFILIPVGLLMVTLSQFIYDSIIEMSNWALNVWPYYSFPFEVIFPLFFWGVAEIKNHFKTK